MPNGKHTIDLPVSIEQIWTFISDINRWAPLVPGYVDHEILSDHQSTWSIKGDLGFMKKKVNLRIDITNWIEPTKVTFDLTGLSDDLTGNGYFEAEAINENNTRITGYLDIEAKGAVGPMVTMTNTVLKKFVPQTAKDLATAVANKIVEIENAKTDTEGDEMSATQAKKFTNINLRTEKNVAYVSINNPPVNALNSETINGLNECIDFIIQNNNVIKAVVITGEGKFFVAGADIKEFKTAIGDTQTGEAMAKKAQVLFNKIEQLDKPVIAAINGACLGGGLELAMCCHIRLAADDAMMGHPEVNLGLIPGFGGTQRLPRLTNKAKAIELILTGEFIKGIEAEKIGLVNQSYSLEDLMPKAKQLAEKIAIEKSVKPVNAALRAITEGAQKDLDEGLEIEAKLFGELFSTEDMKEGIHAFIEKREANFKDC